SSFSILLPRLTIRVAGMASPSRSVSVCSKPRLPKRRSKLLLPSSSTRPGVCYSLNGKDYTLCDPTYINARVGMEMPKIDNTNVTLIPL
ncbi:MAG: hypothetical protein ACI3X6_01185, partial [Alloprevotella sp.]